eukprot:TRINITY_DN18293_c0_g1_i3.p1 TRINITY_DN18293_c0_g1~~TRINITY_DN18293_c0_g1_i3.p1  ORF type:complete len:177 (+),score=47.72 TRINITY_DN18293_c0_g1_i3:183-713(+)
MCIRDSFTLSASLNLAKILRDRQDGEYWVSRPASELPKVRQLAAGTTAHSSTTWVMFGLAVATYFYGLVQFDMAVERRGFLGMGLLFAVASSFNLAKAVRDSSSGLPHLTPSTLHWALYSSAFVISVGVTTGGLYLMPLTQEQKGYQGLGFAWVLSATFNLAKLVRDVQEMKQKSD